MKRGGHINRIGGGRYRVRISVAGRQETVGYFDTEAEAETARDEAIASRRAVRGDYEGRTLGPFGREVLRARELGKRVRDPKSDWSRFEQHIEQDPIAKFALVRLAARAELVSRWLARLEQKGLAVQTRRNCKNLLSVIFQEAVELGYVKENPVRKVGVRGGKAPEAWTYASMPEQGELLGAARLTGAHQHIVGVAVGGGFRAGELVTLRLADVLLNSGPPRILVRYGKAPNLPTKNGRVRAVPLFGVALAAVRAWLELLPSYAPKNPHGLLFPRERGGFRSEEHVIPWEDWKNILARAGITRRFRWHDLRHTCASSLVSGWWGRAWSLSEVKEMLGHTSITVTQRYAHLAPDALGHAAGATPGVSAHVSRFALPAPPAGVEPAAVPLGRDCSIQLSYGGESNELGKPCFPQEQAGIRSADTLLTGKLERPEYWAVHGRYPSFDAVTRGELPNMSPEQQAQMLAEIDAAMRRALAAIHGRVLR